MRADCNREPVMAQRPTGAEPVLGIFKLAGRHELDVPVEWGVRAEDEFAGHRCQGTVLASQPGQLHPVVWNRSTCSCSSWPGS